MANAKMYYNTETSVTPTSTNASTSNPLTYAFDDNIKSLYKTTVITECVIKWNFASSQQLKGIAILNHSQPDTTFKIEASNDDFSTTPFSEDLSISDINTLHSLDLSTYKDIQIRMQASTGTFMSIGQIFFAIDSYVYDRNFNTDFAGGKTAYSIINRSIQAGRVTKKVIWEKYSHNYIFNTILKAQSDTFIEINAYNYVIYQPDSDVSTEFYFGINNYEIPRNVSNQELKNVTGQFEESL